MKKLLIAMMMVVGVTGNANAFEFQTNSAAIEHQIIKQVIGQVLGQTVKIGDKVQIDTGIATTTGQMTKCWVKTWYDGNGNMKQKVMCF